MPAKILAPITCSDYQLYAGKLCKHLQMPEKEGDKHMCALPKHFVCTEMLKHESSRVSHSAIMNNLRCHKLDFLRNIAGVRPIDAYTSEPIKMGNVWESSLEASQGGNYDQLAGVLQSNPLAPKNKAIMDAFQRAFVELKLVIPKGSWQEKRVVGLVDNDGTVHPVSCVFDVVHPETNSFSEIKLTSDFQYYDNVWRMRDQVGLYFVLNPELEYCTMYVAQKPAKQVAPYKPSKTGKGGPHGETMVQFEQRMFMSMTGNPREYFLDYHVDTQGIRQWGRKFTRGMFDLEEIRKRAIDISQLRMRSARNDYWQENSQACYMYGEDCEFLEICKNQGCLTEGFRIKQLTEEK